MGILESILYWNWPRPAQPPRQVLDLTQPSLGGVRLGAPVDRLRELLGVPGSFYAKRRGIWLYPAWGMRFDVVEEQVEGLFVALHRPEAARLAPVPMKWKPFTGTIIFPTQTLPASKLMTRASLEGVLQEPSELHQDEDETVLIYKREGWSLEAALHPEGPLLSLSVVL
jgi:hypothetical protein